MNVLTTSSYWLYQFVVFAMMLQNVLSAGGRTGVVVGPPSVFQTWFIRSDGGTRYDVTRAPSGQCNGKFDASYTSTGGVGVNQNCAFNDLRYMWQVNDGTGGAGTWIASGGDTIVIRGCNALVSQQNPSNPNCRIGFDNDNNGAFPNSWCPFVGNNGCYNPTIPAGTTLHHTKIIGGCAYGTYTCNTGTTTNRGNLTQIFGGFGLSATMNFTNTSNIDFEGIELTTHNGTCSHGGQNFPQCSTNVPYGDFADTGIITNNATSNITFQDVFIDGFEANGLLGPIGGIIRMTRMYVSFNGAAGWQFDDGVSTPDASGSQILASYVTMNGNGCKQEYPLVHTWPALACWDDLHGGFGDAWSGQNTVIDTFTLDHGVMLYNTKDAFIGPHSQVRNLTVTNTVSIGNMGAQMKYGTTTNATTLFQNNLFVMDCGRQSEILPGARQNFNASTGLTGSQLSDFCRAAGDGWAFILRANGTANFYGNTIIGANATMVDISCGFVDGGGFHQETNCNTTPMSWIDNNNLGYTPPFVGAAPGMFFVDPANGTIVFNNSHNNYFGVRNITPDVCGINNITCVDPLLINEPAQIWPGTETALDVFDAFGGSSNSFYPILATSPLVSSGIAIGGLTTDFYGTSRRVPPTIGGVEP